MTSPAAIVGLLVNGFDVQRADLGIFLDLTEGLDEFPAVRGEDSTIPFMPGSLFAARTADSKKLVMTGWVIADRSDGVRAFFNELKRAVDPTAAARITVAATVEDGAEWTIDARPVSLIANSTMPEFHRVSLELDAQPYWRRTWDVDSLDSGLYLDDGLVMDDSSDLDVAPTTDPYDVVFNALGVAPIQDAVMTIYGPSTGVVGIRFTNLGQVGFTFPALGAAEVLVVDTGTRTVTLDSVNARRDLTLLTGNQRGEYFRIAAGSNTLRITGHPAQVTFPFSSCY